MCSSDLGRMGYVVRIEYATAPARRFRLIRFGRECGARMEKGSKTSTALGCALLLAMFAAVVWAVWFFGRRWPVATAIGAALIVLLFVAWIVSLRRSAQKNWHQPIMERVFVELIKLLPKHWNEAVLTLTAPVTGIGHGVAHSVTSPEGHTDPVFPTTAELPKRARASLRCAPSR